MGCCFVVEAEHLCKVILPIYEIIRILRHLCAQRIILCSICPQSCSKLATLHQTNYSLLWCKFVISISPHRARCSPRLQTESATLGAASLAVRKMVISDQVIKHPAAAVDLLNLSLQGSTLDIRTWFIQTKVDGIQGFSRFFKAKYPHFQSSTTNMK